MGGDLYIEGLWWLPFTCVFCLQSGSLLRACFHGATIHYNQAVRRLLATDKNQDLWLERLPAYAPELNPDEGIWQYLKNVELPNLCCLDMKQLRHEIVKAVGRLRHKTHIIKACFQQAGLQL